MKVRPKTLSRQQKINTLDALYTAAASVRGRDATKAFLRDLLTESERIMLGRRILIARALLSGHSYNEINSELGVGSDTIANVDRWITGKSAGYEKVISEMRTEMRSRAKKKRLKDIYTDTSFAGMRAQLKVRYPLHFLLFPWPEKYHPKNIDDI